MRKKILNNWGLKLISLGIAFSLWFVAMQMDDPQDKSTFSNVPVKLINTQSLDVQNMAYEVLDDTDEIRVTVRAPKSIINKLRESDIVATADLSKITEDNMVPISFDVQNVGTNKSDIRVESNVKMVKLNVEEKLTAWVDVKSEVVGEVAEGYMYSPVVSMDQTSVEISGPKSLVEKIDHAKAVININGATNNVSANIGVDLYDKEGNRMDAPVLYEGLSRVHVEVEVLLTKEVPVEAEIMGEPREGYMATGVVEADIPTVMIAGKAGALNNVNKIVVPAEEFDVTDRTTNLVKTVNIRDYMPNNVRFAKSDFNGKVTFTVYVESTEEKTIVIEKDNIEILNLPQGVEGKVLDNRVYSVKISGRRTDIEAVNAEEVKAQVDAAAWMKEFGYTTLKEGRYNMPATIVLDEGITVENKMMVNLTISKKED